MGCNFYTMDDVHIGKRSADGVWCYDCIEKAQMIGKTTWQCPKCGSTRKNKNMYNAAWRELGFDNKPPQQRKGVNGAHSFCWQFGYCGLGNTADEILAKLKELKEIKDEYGETYTLKEFLAIFNEVIKQEGIVAEFL